MKFLSKRFSTPLFAALFLGAAAAVAACWFFLGREREVIEFPRFVNFGRLPIKNGQAVKDFQVELRNNSSETLTIERILPSCYCTTATADKTDLPPKSSAQITIHVELGADELIGRKIIIIVYLKGKEEFTKEMEFVAAADFSNKLHPNPVVFSNVYSGVPRKEVVTIAHPAKEKKTGIVKGVSVKHPEFFRVEISERETQEILLPESEDSFHENKTDITVFFNPKEGMPLKESEITVEFSDGSKQTIPLHWILLRKPIFEPSEKRYFLVRLNLNAAQEFRITCNEDVAGKVKSAKVSGAGLSILKQTREEDALHFQLRYEPQSPSPAAEAKLGELRVETEDGREHKLEIIAS